VTTAAGRTPRSTYRLQLRTGLTLDDVVDGGWLDALVRLGVSHLYLSPVLGAVPGSTHGYDVVDHEHVDAELGGDAAFERLARAARDRGLGLVVDLVPNHMAADPSANARWWDVLRNGPASR
jgi:maltooligosyltrehalose synthase